ncbi:hypothetical protein FJZ39_02675 [Candidatus Saccharibacteria bacterium]|nr:hypothetical protein [Candidatus Saccharibacteria bacterium]
MRTSIVKRVSKRAALGFAALALFVQLFSGVALPGDSNQALAFNRNDPDNIVHGGIKDKNHALSVYDSKSEIRAIYNQFGVTREDIAAASHGSFKTTDFNGKLKVLGRLNHNDPNRYPVKVQGTNTTVYSGEFLGGANRTPGYSFEALIGKRSVDGKWFALMLYCGNIAYVEEPKKPQPKPAAACEAVTITKISRTKVRMNVTASVSNGAKVTGHKYVITSNGSVVSDRTVTTSSLTGYTESADLAPGTYKVKVSVLTTAGTKDSANCEKTFTVEQPPVKNIPVCEIKTGKSITIKETEFNTSKHSKDFDDCKDVKVCDTTTGNIVTIKKSDMNNERYTTDLTKCEKIEVCEIATKNRVTISRNEMDDAKYTTDFSQCEETPVTPPVEPETPAELPKTGIADGLSAALGIGSLFTAALYYAASRRSLLGSLLDR